MSIFDPQATTFLLEHTIGTLSTVDTEGNAHGSVVYYLAEGEMNIYFVSKTETAKVRNISLHQQVALTIFDAPSAQTLQIRGTAHPESDKATIQYIFDNIVKLRPYNGAMLMPPVTALKDSGEYVIVRITPTEAKFSDYKQEIQSNHS